MRSNRDNDDFILRVYVQDVVLEKMQDSFAQNARDERTALWIFADLATC